MMTRRLFFGFALIASAHMDASPAADPTSEELAFTYVYGCGGD
jgi:hypothetical protein